MIRRLALALALLLIPAAASAQSLVKICVESTSSASGVVQQFCTPVSGVNPLPVSMVGAFPSGSTPVTNSATGTTNATVATLPGVAGKTTYLCGFSIRANATAAATGNATVTGTIGGTLNFTQFTAANTGPLSPVEPIIPPVCIPASAPNTAIVVTSAAPGAGGVVSVTAWGFQL